MNTPHETTSEEKCCINCDDLGNCAFVDCKCHYAMSEEVKKAFGMDIIIDESLPENTFVLSNDVKKEVKENWEGLTHFENKLAQEILGALHHRGFYDAEKYLDPTIIERIRPLLADQRSLAQQEILDRAQAVVLRRTEIPKDARNPTRDATVILGEEIVELLEELRPLSTLKDTNI